MKPTVRKWAVLVLIGILAMMMAGCDGGGGGSGDSPTVPAAPKVTASNGIKSVILSWGAVSGATHYRVYKDPDGVSGFGQIGVDQASTSYSDTIALHLTDWVNVRYKVGACNSEGETDSNIITGPNLLKAIGYFKASNGPDTYGNFGGQFGASVALSADGSTMAVGAFTEESIATGIGGDQTDVSGGSTGAVYLY